MVLPQAAGQGTAMETFTELKPEALEWPSPAKRSRQLRGWSEMGPTGWSRVGHTPALDPVHQSNVHF